MLRRATYPVVAYLRRVKKTQFTPLENPPDYDPSQSMLPTLSRADLSPARIRHAIVLGWRDYKSSWRIAFPSSKATEELDRASGSEGGELGKSGHPGRRREENNPLSLDETVQVLKGVGGDVGRNLREMSPEAKERFSAFASERMQVAKECLREFLGGYREGVEAERLKDEEDAREAAMEDMLRVSSPPHPSNSEGSFVSPAGPASPASPLPRGPAGSSPPEGNSR